MAPARHGRASTGSTASASSLAGAWFPNETRFLAKAASDRGDELPARLRDADLAYALEPGFDSAVTSRARSPRRDAPTRSGPRGDAARGGRGQPRVEGLPPRAPRSARRKAGRAMSRLEDAGNVGMLNLIDVAEVAGRAREVATTWAERFLSLPEDEASMTARGFDAPISACAHAPTSRRAASSASRGSVTRRSTGGRRRRRAPRRCRALRHG